MQNKSTMELEDFEAENLAKLQKMFSRKWEFVFMQAEAQYKYEDGANGRVMTALFQSRQEARQARAADSRQPRARLLGRAQAGAWLCEHHRD